VEGNPVFVYHDAFNPDVEEVSELKARYRQGRVGDVEVKRKLAKAVNEFLEPMRQRRIQYESQPGLVDDILIEGSRRVRAIAQETMGMVYEAMGLYGPQLLKAYSMPLGHSEVPALPYC
jgi:tryptophanyl-tRNA synthetase